MAETINHARLPVVFIGAQAINTEVSAAIIPFLEKLHVPFIETYMAKGVVPGDHPLHLQTIGLTEGDFANHAFDLSDLIITIGYDSIEYGAKKWNKLSTPVVHIEYSPPAKADPYYPVKAMLTGDMATNLREITKHIQKRNGMDPSFQQLKEIITKDTLLHNESNRYPLLPQRVVKDIREILSSDDILVSDVGAHKNWIGRQYETYKMNTFITSNGLASMGIGLPGAIGAKMACPAKKVMAVCGDGAFIMSLSEFETAVRLKLSIVILIWRDGRYGAIEWEQTNKIGRATSITFNNPDFVALAESYGAKGYRVDTASQLADHLKRAFEHDSLVVIDCPVDYTENFRLSERLNYFKESVLIDNPL
jgi:acetolactate synthase-1/2/3 large subunit